jgi:hypothetical protein
MWLSNVVQNQLEMGQLQELHVKGWNDHLTNTREDPQNPASPEQFPYDEPKIGRIGWLRSRWVHLAFIVSIPLASSVLYYLSISAEIASRDAAFSGAIALAVVLIASYTTYMTLGRQKKS